MASAIISPPLKPSPMPPALPWARSTTSVWPPAQPIAAWVPGTLRKLTLIVPKASYSPSFRFKISFSACGLALPPLAFIAWPTNQPISVGLASTLAT